MGYCSSAPGGATGWTAEASFSVLLQNEHHVLAPHNFPNNRGAQSLRTPSYAGGDRIKEPLGGVARAAARGLRRRRLGCRWQRRGRSIRDRRWWLGWRSERGWWSDDAGHHPVLRQRAATRPGKQGASDHARRLHRPDPRCRRRSGPRLDGAIRHPSPSSRSLRRDRPEAPSSGSTGLACVSRSATGSCRTARRSSAITSATGPSSPAKRWARCSNRSNEPLRACC